MSVISHTIVRSSTIASGRTTLQKSETVSGDYERNVRMPIPAQSGSPLSGANFQVNWSCTRSLLQSFVISASRDIDVYTNAASSGAYQEHIHIKAGYVYIWTLQADEIARCPFAGDITALFITPPVGGDAVDLSIDALVNNS